MILVTYYQKIDRLAVLLAGELRTWDSVCPYIFSFFECRAKQVDYFFATWNTDGINGVLRPVTPDEITSPFTKYKQNLIEYRLEERIPRRPNTYYYQSWLALRANKLKREYEQDNNFVYDQVVETRPDLYIRKLSNKPFELIPPMTVFNNRTVCEAVEGIPVIHKTHIDDVYIRSDSLTNDIIGQRYYYSFPEEYHKPKNINGNIVYDPNYTNHHCIYGNYLREKNIIVTNKFCDYLFRIVTRPNFPFDNLDAVKGKTLWDEYYWKWQDSHLTVENNRKDPINFIDK